MGQQKGGDGVMMRCLLCTTNTVCTVTAHWDPTEQFSVHTTTPGSLSSSMIYDVDTQLTYLYQARILSVLEIFNYN